MEVYRRRRANGGKGHLADCRGFVHRYRGAVLFAVVALVMGSGYVAIRIGTETVPPAFLAALRFDLSATILLTYAVRSGRWRPRVKHDVVAIFVLGGFILAGTVGLVFVGQRYTTTSVVAVVMGFVPVLTVPLAYLLVPDERLSRTDAVGSLLGFVGVAIVARPSTGTATDESIGVVLVLCAALSSSLGSVLLGRIETELSPVSLTGWGALIGGLALHLVSVGLGEPVGTARWTPASFVALVYLAVVVGVGGYVALLGLLAEVGPTRSSLTSFASPIVAIVVGWLMLGEAVATVTLIGFFVISVGFGVSNRAALISALGRSGKRHASG